MPSDIPPLLPRVIVNDKIDHMKHFTKEHWGVKLTALLLCRLPYILAACTGLVLWWWRIR